MQRIQRILVILLFTTLGGFMMMLDIWPMSGIREAYVHYFLGNRWRDLRPLEVLYSDLGIYPYPQIAPLHHSRVPEREYVEIAVEGMRARRAAPLLYIDAAAREPAYTLVAGLLDTETSLGGVLLFDANGHLAHQWDIEIGDHVSGGDLDEAGSPATPGALMHGLEVFPDGSLIAAFHKSPYLTRYDACGRVIWRTSAMAHHSVVADGDGHVWTWDANDMIRVRISDGAIVRRIGLTDLAETSPGKYILSARRYFSARHGSAFRLDPFHANDIEPLRAEIAGPHDGFEPGDLLVSLRSGSVVFVVDPDTEEIKWWVREGFFAQHDPDWRPDGSIVIFDNNTDFGMSRVVKIDPETGRQRVLVDGVEHDLYTDLMGNQDIRDDGSILINSARQGRVFELGPDGRVVFEFLNRYDRDTGRNGITTEARTLPLDFFADPPGCGIRETKGTAPAAN